MEIKQLIYEYEKKLDVMKKKQKKYLKEFKNYDGQFVATPDGTYSYMKRNIELVEEAIKQFKALDVLLECTHIDKKRVKSYFVKSHKSGTTYDYRINSTSVSRQEYHLVEKLMKENGWY